MEVKPGYKQTGVGILPEEWEVKPVGDIVSLYQPETISAKLFKESGFPVYGANGIVGYYHSANHQTWQVTVTCRGSTCGTVNRTVDQCWITGNAMVLNCDANAGIDKEFLYFLMLSQNLSNCITGTGQPQIVRSPLAAFQVGIPAKLSEQREIAEALSDADALIESLEQLITKKRNIKQGAMQELLLPKKEWVEKQLGKTATLKARIGWQGLTVSEYLDSGNYYLVTGTDFKEGFIDWSN
jgi:type I restriction enzyme, S subunit